MLNGSKKSCHRPKQKIYYFCTSYYGLLVAHQLQIVNFMILYIPNFGQLILCNLTWELIAGI
jgi:hypothetical protein